MNETLRDWRHASHFYLPNDYQYVPKVKFLYHTTFYLGASARSLLPTAYQHIYQIGMLVRSIDLPNFSANIKTLNKYNRKKNVQTHITYNPVNILFHDDNYGITRHLLEGYYNYYYADGSHTPGSGAYGSGPTGDTTYRGETYNKYRFGLDNHDNKPDYGPFFEQIDISQLSRGQSFTYSLFKPLVTEWGHDNLDNTQSGGIMENKLVVAYEGVKYSTGNASELLDQNTNLDLWENEDSRVLPRPDITAPSPDRYA